MKRTITMKSGEAYYRGNQVNYVLERIRNYFKLKNSRMYKYAITIVEGTEYRFEKYVVTYALSNRNGAYIGIVCITHFDKLFFKPDPNKRYDITVKKVRIEKNKLNGVKS